MPNLKLEDLTITTCEMHTGGEPVRIIESGYPEIKGDTILAKRRYARENLDDLRKAIHYCEILIEREAS